MLAFNTQGERSYDSHRKQERQEIEREESIWRMSVTLMKKEGQGKGSRAQREEQSNCADLSFPYWLTVHLSGWFISLTAGLDTHTHPLLQTYTIIKYTHAHMHTHMVNHSSFMRKFLAFVFPLTLALSLYDPHNLSLVILFIYRHVHYIYSPSLLPVSLFFFFFLFSLSLVQYRIQPHPILPILPALCLLFFYSTISLSFPLFAPFIAATYSKGK